MGFNQWSRVATFRTASRGRERVNFRFLVSSDDRAWMVLARCRGTDPDLFHPGRGESLDAAKAVCRDCTVREECLEYALLHGERLGVWGGLSEAERRRFRRARSVRRAG